MRTAALGLALIFLASHATLSQFIYQNWSIYLALILGAAWSALERGRDVTAALLFALAVAMKLYLILLLLPFLLGGRRRFAATVCIIIVLLGALSIPLVAPDTYPAYGRAMIRQSRAGVLPFFNLFLAPFARDCDEEAISRALARFLLELAGEVVEVEISQQLADGLGAKACAEEFAEVNAQPLVADLREGFKLTVLKLAD